MNKLEQYIRNNRDRFDALEPSAGHTDRFKARLAPATLPAFARIPGWLRIAAVIVLVAGSSIFSFEQFKKYYADRNPSLQELIPGEFQEASLYYTSLIKEKYSEIDRLNSSVPDRNEILLKELDEMDRLFNTLMKDLKANPMDERVLSAMINHYQMKLEVMGQIIQQLEEANQLNSTFKSHENEDV